jgi:putative (di)nucleoside polyphosphate hydrolase
VEESGPIPINDSPAVVDAEGFRPNVGIVLAGAGGRVLWAKRIGMDAWQFPQGGINPGETPEQALFRELREELGLEPEAVDVLGGTRDWLRYTLPRRFVRKGQVPQCIGQKQRWFALRLKAPDSAVRFDRGDKPEFDDWRWVDYWHPLHEVVAFKRTVYEAAMRELEPLVRAGATQAHGDATPAQA